MSYLCRRYSIITMNPFKRLLHISDKQPDPSPLRIEGVGAAPLTPEPDNAEKAAAALLELLSGTAQQTEQKEPPRGTSEYYHHIANSIRMANDSAMIRATRFIAWAEVALQNKDLPREGKGSLVLIEAELYKRMDTVERVGGELKKRWQHCLAEVTVRLMKEELKN